jgi:tripartite-type tricarboxylate transporter receptor subunit TctC
LHQEISAILETAEVQNQLAAQGAETVRMSSAEFGGFMAREMDKWERVVKEGKIRPE